MKPQYKFQSRNKNHNTSSKQTTKIKFPSFRNIWTKCVNVSPRTFQYFPGFDHVLCPFYNDA